jgi:hypothetical protein
VNQRTKLLLTLSQVEDIIKLIEGNEYEDYFTSHLIPIQVELNRQLTNLTQSSKIKE